MLVGVGRGVALAGGTLTEGLREAVPNPRPWARVVEGFEE